MITRFCLIRHGETDWNAEKRIQGQIDIGLNAIGEAQARAVRPGLGGRAFSAVYSSDLQRAWRTAELATSGLGLPAVAPAPSFRERHYGVYQGLTAAEALACHPEVHRHHTARSLDYDYETGESLVDFALRVMDTLSRWASEHAGGTVLAFTHGGVLDIAYRAGSGRDLESPRDFTIPNAAINWLEHDAVADAWRMVAWADRRHLERALDEVVE
jgi:2,3-bisphosphoglycerate-dependent phosphoglycerate mutase